MENKIISVTYLDKTVEFPFSLDYKAFIKECQEKFNLSNEEIGGINFYYTDEEGDSVSVSSVFDYEQAMKVMQGSDLKILNFSLELKVNQSISLIPNVNQSPITDSMRSGAIFENFTLEKTESNLLDNLDNNNENQPEENDEEKGRKIKKELERKKEEQRKQEEETQKSIKLMKEQLEIEKKRKQEEDRKRQEEEKKKKEEEEKRRIIEEEEERKRIEEERRKQEEERRKQEEFKRKQQEELLKAKKEEEERIRRQKEIEEKKKEEERAQKELKAVETFIQSKRKEKIIKLLKSNFTLNKKQEHLLKLSKISEKVIERDTLNAFKRLPPKPSKSEEEDIKIKLERKKRIMEQISQKARQSFVQSKISQSSAPNRVGYQMSGEFNNEQYESTIENIKKEAEQRLKSQVKLLEKEFEKMKKTLIQKTMEENNQILKTYVDKLSILEKERQSTFQTQLSKIPQNKDNFNFSMSISAIHSNIKCELCSRQPIVGIRYKCAVCPNYNLCEECEEKNYETKAHPHDFLRIRDPRNDKIKQIQSNGQDFSDNVIQAKPKFSFELLTKNLILEVEKGSTKLLKHKLVLKNNYGMSWNQGTTFLKCDKLKSGIIAEDISLPALSSDQKTEVFCAFNNCDTMEVGSYNCFLVFNVDGLNYGEPITIMVNVIPSKNVSQIETNVNRFREVYSFDKSYSDDDLTKALVKNNNDFEKAYDYLLTQIIH